MRGNDDGGRRDMYTQPSLTEPVVKADASNERRPVNDKAVIGLVLAAVSVALACTKSILNPVAFIVGVVAAVNSTKAILSALHERTGMLALAVIAVMLSIAGICLTGFNAA